MAMLAKHPDDRPESADVASALLRDALAEPLVELDDGDRTVALPRDRVFKPAISTKNELAHLATSATGSRRVPSVLPGTETGLRRAPSEVIAPRSRSRAPLVVGLALVLVAAGVAAMVATLGAESEPPAALATKVEPVAPEPTPAPIAPEPTPGRVAPTASTSAPVAPTAVAPTPAAPEPVAAPSEPAPEPVVAAGPYAVELHSEPKATVMRDGQEIGTTPLTVTWPRDTTAPTITLVARGFVTATVEFAPGDDAGRRDVKLTRRPATGGKPVGGATGPTW
jgi:hypothetical protein